MKKPTKAPPAEKAPKLQDFEVNAEVTISISKTIRTTSAEEAKKIAKSLGLPGLCHFCASAGSDDNDTWELSGEIDGTPVSIRVTNPAD